MAEEARQETEQNGAHIAVVTGGGRRVPWKKGWQAGHRACLLTFASSGRGKGTPAKCSFPGSREGLRGKGPQNQTVFYSLPPLSFQEPDL